ncbi:MBL fold metallo-hydrolase [Desulfonema ishimotonii]|uniref:MBL fold metallo-hydrolase n=1 Tax=Desulfonema ishimotonii TaxID=45657 RepID=A0A401G0W3_9BACT|nr:MBL fold metallo-hydrolase [Desulfonema ishimotonii]GBC62862.1 MBL fold metallo-hydrolase [Desulfonema ishimotonii]
MKKITDEVYQIGGSGLTDPEDAASYLIRFDGHAAVIDAGCGKSVGQLLKNIRACGVRPDQVEYLLLTHCHFDHVGGAKTFRNKVRCQVVAHELDAPFLEKGDSTVTAATWYGSDMEPTPVDIRITRAQESLPLGDRTIEAIHIPGHSPGSLAYLFESGGLKVLFAQDVHGPLAPTLLSNEADYQKSLRILLSLEADILCEGHYGVFTGKDEVRKFILSFVEGDAEA